MKSGIFFFANPLTITLLIAAGMLINGTVTGSEVAVPIGGNSWIKGGSMEKITPDGLMHWSSSEAVLETYVRLAAPALVKMSVRAVVAGKSRVKVTVAGRSETFDWEGPADTHPAGEWEIREPGYIKITLQGLSRTTDTYAMPSAWLLDGVSPEENAVYVKNNQDNYFYWGRRGPSVHLNYPLPAGENVEWFYNEVTVPEGQDVIGSYFMANGFAEGYFGMQVNSATERRVLFSVWSPFRTDDPKSIPKDQQIRLLRKGEQVHTGEFGNEGAGGQSYLRYNWQAGRTYRFLLQGKPTGDSTTLYTAYFFAPEQGDWQLIASFERPRTHTYLMRLHSFLENFIPTTGDAGREVYFGDQWICTSAGQWSELTTARFTADATARKAYRLDYAGGSVNDRFYLKNCGFFNEFTEIGKSFTRSATTLVPKINFRNLP